MVNVILNGCGGRMGHFVAAQAKASEDVRVIAGVDPMVKAEDKAGYDFPVFASLKECEEGIAGSGDASKGDVIIDFGWAGAVDGLLDFVEESGIPCVLCTTGLSDEQLGRLEKVAKKAALLRSANMSYGVNLLFRILEEYSAALAAAGFDIEIVEKHHNQKLDSPSGTAIAMAEAVNRGLNKNNDSYEFVYDRSTRREKRPKNEIGISAVRGGSIVGDHDVIFAGKDEVVTFSHTAYSRELFANGSLMAARFLKGAAPGLYSMADVIS